MLVKHLCCKTRSEITAFKLLEDDSLAFSTKLHGAKLFSHLQCSVIKNLSIELLGYKTTAVAFSASSNLLAFANSNVIYVLDTQNKLLLQSIKTFEGEIEILSFVPNSRYIVAGTKFGRVMQYRYDGLSHLSRLCSFGQNKTPTHSRVKNNYVSAFAFVNNIFACSGYGGVITILKMNSYQNRYNIETSKVRINALCFLDEDRLVSGNVDGVIQIHSLKKYHNVKSISTPFRNINTIIKMQNPEFIMVSAESEKLILINTQTAKVVSNSYLTFEGSVSKITLTKENTLLAVVNNKEFYKVELPSAEHIKSFILHNSLDKAYEIIDNDPMLQGTREHKRVEVMYEKLYAKAIEALINSNTKEARKLLQMFSQVQSKQDDVNAIFKAFEFYPRFKTLYLDKKYALSYAMAEKHPALKRTAQYKKMEELFKENFTFAQKQILMGRQDLAKEILSVYATVLSKKPMLKLILNQNKDFIEFLQAINEKNYTKVELLVKKNETFSQIPSYLSLQKELQTTLAKIRTLINKGEAENAVELIKTLLDIPSIKDELQALYTDTKELFKLQKAYEADDFVSCYEILDASTTLDSLNLSKLLEKHWDKLIRSCENYALKGDIKSIKKTLSSLIRVKSRVDKIGDLLRLSFHIKIKALMSKRSFKSAENIIYSYIDIFGIDSELQLIMKTYQNVSKKKLAITINQEKRVPRDNWLNSELIMN